MTSVAGKPRRPQHDEFKMVGKYKVKGAIGEGVNGAVRLGVDPVTGVKVALKFMSKLNLKDRQKERLDREVRFLTLLHHPNIVNMLDMIETDQYIIFVMERVRKGELLKYITEHGSLTEAKFRPIFRSILSAVDYCHRNSVVHRDLKPENILLDDSKTPKIIDFGLSNLYDNEHLLETFCGSPKYAAPEIISGTKYLGPSVDIWSLGVILFASLCGNLPFAGSTIEKTYQRVLAGKINFPATLSPEAKDYIARILKVDVNERMTMEEMLQHPWLNKGYEGPPPNFLPARPNTVESIDENLVERTLEFGYTREQVLQALHHPEMDPIKNTYFLLAERRDRLDAEQMHMPEQHHGFIRDKAAGVLGFLFNTLKAKKFKLEKEGFVLDMTYVTDRMIRMGFPSEDDEDTIYNPIDEVHRYFERYHKDHYKVFNLCPGDNGGYDPAKLGGHVARFPISPNGPSFDSLVKFCMACDEWLAADPLNVAAVHSKGDFSRTAIAICSWLLHTGLASKSTEAVQTYMEKLVSDKSVHTLPPSLRRYIDYYEAFVHNKKIMPSSKLFSVTAVFMSPVPEFDVYGGCEPIVRVDLDHVRVGKAAADRHYSAANGDVQIVVETNTVPVSEDVCIRVLDKDRMAAEEMFSFRINLRFLDICHKVGYVQRSTLMLLSTGSHTDKATTPQSNRLSFVGTLRRIRNRLSEFAEPVVPQPTVQASSYFDVDAPKTAELAATSKPAETGGDSLGAPDHMDREEDAALQVARARHLLAKRMDEESMWKHDDDSDSEEESLKHAPPRRAMHPLEKSDYDDSAAVEEPSSSSSTYVTASENVATMLAPKPQPTSSGGTGDPYVANRLRLTLTKADLDIERPERFPDDFTVTVLLKEPRLRRYTAEDIEETARREADGTN